MTSLNMGLQQMGIRNNVIIEEQHPLSKRLLKPEELFAPETHESFKI